VDLYEAIRKRRMVRSFTDEPVAAEVVERIADAARRGPSAGYSQGVEFVVVTDEAKRDAIAAPADAVMATSGHNNFIRQAPVHIVICVNPEIYKSRYRESDKMRVRREIDDDALWRVPYWYTDAGAAMMIILLAAVSEGIAAAFAGLPGGNVRRLLGIPGDYAVIGVALLGHEAADAREYGDISARPRKRRPMSEVVHREQW
jgi:nitroreductase